MPLIAQHAPSERWSAWPLFSPAFGKRDLRNWAPRQWPVFFDWIADGHQGEREHVVQQTENRTDIILVQDMVGGDQRSETKRPARQDNVLYRWVDARTA